MSAMCHPAFAPVPCMSQKAPWNPVEFFSDFQPSTAAGAILLLMITFSYHQVLFQVCIQNTAAAMQPASNWLLLQNGFGPFTSPCRS